MTGMGRKERRAWIPWCLGPAGGAASTTSSPPARGRRWSQCRPSRPTAAQVPSAAEPDTVDVKLELFVLGWISSSKLSVQPSTLAAYLQGVNEPL